MKQNSKFLLVFLALGFLFACAQAPQRLVSEKPIPSTADLASKKIRDSIVLIESENASGTGFFVAPNKIATNIHVIAHAGPVSVKSPNKEKDWTIEIEGVVGFDAKNSLVILKLTSEGKPLPLADSRTAQIGESISIPGYLNGEYTVPKGNIQSILKNNKWLRIKATKETEGSPVLNNNGQVIGVIVSYGSYTVPSSALAALLNASMPMEPLSEWQQRKPVRAAASYSLGKEKFGAKDYAGAVVNFDKAIELNPEYVYAYYERSRAQAYLGDYDSAIASCTQVIEIDPDAPDAYYLRGSVKARLGGDYAAAVIDLDKAIELDTQHADAYSNRGGIKYGLGESESARGNAEAAQRLYEAAIADCDKAIQIDPEDANTYNNRAAARLALGNFEEAILDLNRSIEIDSEDADAYNNRGLVKIRRGESEAAGGNAKKAQHLYKAAIKDITRAIQIDPENASAYNNRGIAKFSRGESKSAQANGKKVKKAQRLYEAKVKKAQRLYEAAIADYTQAIKINPKYADAYENQGRARSHLGASVSDRGEVEKARELYKAAVKDYTQVVKINPEDADTYNDLAAAKCKLGDIESARGDAEKAQRLYHDGITDYDKYIQLNNPEDVNESAADLASEKVKNSTVHVMSWAGDFYSGSGFFVDEDRIATNIHVVAQPGPVFVKLRAKGEVWAVEEVKAYDVENDLVTLKIEGRGTPLPLGNSDAVQSGEQIIVVGYPGDRYKTTQGTLHNIRNTDKWLRTKVDTAGGSSGGPTLNRSGHVIGIHAASSARYSYAIPSNVLKGLLAEAKPTEPLTEWQQRTPIRAYAYHIQGQIKYNADHYQEAIAAFNKAVQLNPETLYTYYKRGEAKAALGEHEAAIADYDKAIQLNAEDIYLYYNRGQARETLGDYEAAVADYDKAIQLDPEYANAYNRRGVLYDDFGDLESARGNMEKAETFYKAAIADYDKAIQLNPKNAAAYNNRGVSHDNLGDLESARGNTEKAETFYKAAIADYDKAIQLNPKNADVYKNRGVSHDNLGDLESTRGNTEKAQAFYKAAITDYDKVIQLDPEYTAAYNNRGVLYDYLGDLESTRGNTEKAQAFYKAAIADYDRTHSEYLLRIVESYTKVNHRIC